MRNFKQYIENIEKELESILDEGQAIQLRNTNAYGLAKFIASIMKTSKDPFFQQDEAVKSKLKALGLERHFEKALAEAKEMLKEGDTKKS